MQRYYFLLEIQLLSATFYRKKWRERLLFRYKIVSFKKFYLKFKELTILQTLSEEFKKQKQQTLSAESSLLPQKGQALPDLFKSHFPYNYPFIYKIITFSCINFAISDIYAYLCRC